MHSEILVLVTMVTRLQAGCTRLNQTTVGYTKLWQTVTSGFQYTTAKVEPTLFYVDHNEIAL